MSNDFVMDILNSAFQEQLDKFRADGLSDSEIINRFSEQRIENVLSETTEEIVADVIETMESTMYERVLEERSNGQILSKSIIQRLKQNIFCKKI